MKKLIFIQILLSISFAINAQMIEYPVADTTKVNNDTQIEIVEDTLTLISGSGISFNNWKEEKDTTVIKGTCVYLSKYNRIIVDSKMKKYEANAMYNQMGGAIQISFKEWYVNKYGRLINPNSVILFREKQ